MSTNFNTKTLEVLDRLMKVEKCDSYSQLSTHLGVGRSNISTWKKRGNIPYDIFVEYANKKGYSLDWVMNGIGEMHKPDPTIDYIVEQYPEAKDTAADYKNVGLQSFTEGFEQIPYLDVEAAIMGIIRADESMGTLPFKKELLEKMGLTKADVYYTKPESDAMSPTIQHDGIDTLLIEPNNKVVKDTSIYAIVIQGEMLHRRLHKTVGGGIKITSDNTLYPDIDLNPDQAKQLHIVGRVRFKSRFDEM